MWILALVITALVALPGHATAARTTPGTPGTRESAPSTVARTFALPQPGRVFQFPADHGSHPEFKIEWWYLTGHLTSEGGRRHGFQATFFRRASEVSAAPHPSGTIAPAVASPSTPPSPPNFASDEFFLAHMAWLDVDTKTFRHEERLNRRGWDAQAATNRLEVRNGNWSLQDLGPDAQGHPTLELRGGIQADLFWRMRLTPKKPLVVFGTNGVSRKAREPSAASHYLTFPRLAVTGELRRGSQTARIEGEAWMDHELSSSQLGEGQVGWDWTSIQFFDGRELMAYRMRRDDGSTDPFSTVAWVGQDGRVSQWGPDRFTWRGEGQWKSPRSGGTYPATVLLTVPEPDGRPGPTWRIEPLCADQELSGGIGGVPYWEGACRVLDASGREVGRAFVEMTGYAGHLRRAL
jgi:predicted secreted hydrolase